MPSPDTSSPAGALEIRGPAHGLLDDPFVLRLRGAGSDAEVTWRARYRDDDGRVWRAVASRSEDLTGRWQPAKDGSGDIAALRSLRPVSIDVRAETADGRAAARTFVRQIAAEGVRTRRWRDGLAATLHVPARRSPCATVIVNAAGTDAHVSAAMLAAPLLAARGVLALVVVGARGADAGDGHLALARERLGAVPGSSAEILLLCTRDPLSERAALGEDAVVLPPNVGARETRDGAPAERAATWDALLARLLADRRVRQESPTSVVDD